MDAREVLDLSRQAHRRRDWAGAYEGFSAADRSAPLQGGDLERLAEAAELLGRADEAVGYLERAFRTYADLGDCAGAVRCAWWLYYAFRLRGEPAHAGGWLRRGRRLAEDKPAECPERGYLLIPEAERLNEAGDFSAAYRVAAQAVRTGDRGVTALAQHVQGRAWIKAGRVQEGLALLDEVMVMVASGDISARVSGWIYCSVVDACHELHELRRAREWTTTLAQWCDAQPGLDGAYPGMCRIHRAEILRVSGAWAQAVQEAQLAGEQLTRGFGRNVAGAAYYQLGEVHRLRGEITDAERAYEQADQWGWDPQPGLALLRLAQGKAEGASATVRRALGETSEQLARARLLPAYVEIALAVRDFPIAQEAAAELTEIASTYDVAALHALAAHAQGSVRLAEGDHPAALIALRRAWRLWHDLDAPYEAARSRLLIGQVCHATGDEDTGGMEVRAAHRVLRQLGATTGSGPGGAPSPAAGVAGLTAREAQVLRLIAAGKSNRDIAAELFLSEKTVARHVSNLLTKLSVTSRTAAAAYAYEHDLVRTPRP
jgi:DNA-binding CsgD family transcriptional regulator